MKNVTRWTVGAFGCLFHVAAAGLLALKAARSPVGDAASLLGPAIAAAVAAFVVYAILVAPYARKRYGSAKKGVVLYDFLVGMLAEVAVVGLGSLLYALGAARGAMAGGLAAYGAQVLNTTAVGFLWTIATAMTEVLALGNGAGFVGYIVLKKLAAREAAAAARAGG